MKKPAKLATESRPAEVALWIKRYRTSPVHIKNVGAFENKWWTWWALNQPMWRGRCADGRPEKVDTLGKSWGNLAVYRQNGLLSVVATLYWWGCMEQTRDTGDISAGWLDAVRDMAWVMAELLAAESSTTGT
ncbi:hypothetical protein GGX14DRAFT_368798 [Mycena pura]|uniref:Uncharacterized protein n=1 Tax=Mycena pura TaxID=153505 RepID=A0AAD6V705_9AGAR|nr:hypothetical protein GGX14DRAFT_368798 [Mycena pura]